MGNGRNTGESLAAKSKGVNLNQVFGARYLTCGMTREGQLELIRAYSSTVIEHPDAGQTPIDQLDIDPSCTCINCIFN